MVSLLHRATIISESYAQQLQELAEKFYKYPRFHYLPIEVSDLYEIRENIKDMLAIRDIADYWKDPAVYLHLLCKLLHLSLCQCSLDIAV